MNKTILKRQACATTINTWCKASTCYQNQPNSRALVFSSNLNCSNPWETKTAAKPDGSRFGIVSIFITSSLHSRLISFIYNKREAFISTYYDICCACGRIPVDRLRVKPHFTKLKTGIQIGKHKNVPADHLAAIVLPWRAYKVKMEALDNGSPSSSVFSTRQLALSTGKVVIPKCVLAMTRSR